MHRIGLLTYALHRSPGGIGRYTRELLSGFSIHGLTPLLLRSGNSTGVQRSVKLRGSGLLPALLTLGQIEIGIYARKLELELVHDPTGTAPLLLTSPKKVVTIHDASPQFDPKTSTALERLIYHFWLPCAVKHVDHFLTVSNHSREDIARFLGVPMKKITVIPLAAGRQFRPLPGPEVQPVLDRVGIQFPYILYVGSLEPRKNLGRLLEAYALLLDWSSQWHLVIVGARNIWKSEPLGKLVQQYKLEPYVHFTGYIPDAGLPALYNGADLFVFPSLYEGFGLPVLESMACGTPVVTSNTSSLPEITGDAAFLVDPYSVEDIAGSMQRVLSNKDLAQDLRSRGLERAKLFTWERTASQTIAVYEQLLGGKITP
jgi:glycosyltransferase involved in cell wall biosynthesis